MKIVSRYALPLLCFSLVLGVQVSAQENDNEKADFKALDALIAEHVADKDISGLAYAVVKGKEMIWSGAGNKANLKTYGAIPGEIRV